MSRVKTAWQALLDQPYDDKRPTEPRINDPYNLWDNDDNEPQTIDINDYADKED